LHRDSKPVLNSKKRYASGFLLLTCKAGAARRISISAQVFLYGARALLQRFNMACLGSKQLKGKCFNLNAAKIQL